MIQEKNCEFCGEPFHGTKRARFCSTNCRVKSNRGKTTGQTDGGRQLITAYCRKHNVTVAQIIEFLESSFTWKSKTGQI